jgi:hypothetical protein
MHAMSEQSPPAPDPKKDKPVKFGGALPRAERQRESDENTLELFFSRKPLPREQPVLVFQHLRKTAGTAIRRAIQANFHAELHLFAPTPKVDTAERTIQQSVDDYYGRLRGKERNMLLGLASHSANYFIGVIDRPVVGFTVLRDPVDRVLSRHYFHGTPRPWTLVEAYSDPVRFDLKGEFYNGAARGLLEPHYDTSELALTVGVPPDANLWRARLFEIMSRHYVVGLQERLPESLSMLAYEMGWRKLRLEPVRVNATRPRRLELSAEEYELIRAANWLDVELYEHYAATFPQEPRGLPIRVVEGIEARALEPGYVLTPSAAPEPDGAVPTSPSDSLELATSIRVRALEERVRTLERALNLVGWRDEGRKRPVERAAAAAEANPEPTLEPQIAMELDPEPDVVAALASTRAPEPAVEPEPEPAVEPEPEPEPVAEPEPAAEPVAPTADEADPA